MAATVSPTEPRLARAVPALLVSTLLFCGPMVLFSAFARHFGFG